MGLSIQSETGLTSWGRIHRRTQRVVHARFADEIGNWAVSSREPRLAVGLRRSYGDSVLSSQAALVDMTALDRIISFDADRRILRAEAGLTFDALMRIFAPRGCFPVTCPGTRYVTLGGAVANDVHGKNHHQAGAFGNSVLGFTLARSDRGVVEVTPQAEPELFAASIGGLGLTGVILDVTVQLADIPSTELDVETAPLQNLSEFFALADESAAEFEHTVAWVDCTATGPALGRGVFQRANWAKSGGHAAYAPPPRTRIVFDAPGFALNPLSLKLFNALYHSIQKGRGARREPYWAVFHPLDAVQDWNRLYGRRGFFQYQCVVPRAHADAIGDMLRIIARSGEGSFLVVLKSFGPRTSPGLLSFPMEGYTLALDFRNRGEITLRLMSMLDQVVSAAQGRLYPAKDGRMPRAMFEAGYGSLARFKRVVDPLCTSDFWRRMAGETSEDG